MNNQFNIGDIIINTNPKKDNTFWVVFGFFTSNKLRGGIMGHYKLVPLHRLDETNYPFEVDFAHAHEYYARAT